MKYLLGKQHIIAIVLLITGLAWAITDFIPHLDSALRYPLAQNYTDIQIFLAADRAFLDGGHLYHRSITPAIDYAPGAVVYKFPPTYQLTLYPLLFFNLDDAGIMTIVRLIQVFLYVVASVLLLHLIEAQFFSAIATRSLRWIFRLVSAIFLLLNDGFLDCLSGMEPELYIYAFLVFALYALCQQRHATTGAWIAAAAAIKLYPVLFLALAVATRQWRIVYGFFLGLCALLLVSLSMFGPSEHLYYFQTILPVLLAEKTIYHIQNLSLSSFLIDNSFVSASQGWLAPVTKIIALVFLAINVLVCRSNLTTPKLLVFFSLLCALVLLVLVNYWPQYLIILIIPFTVLLAHFLQSMHRVGLFFTGICILALCIRDSWFQDVASHWTGLAIQFFNAHPDFFKQHEAFFQLLPPAMYFPPLWILIKLREVRFFLPLILAVVLTYIALRSRRQ